MGEAMTSGERRQTGGNIQAMVDGASEFDPNSASGDGREWEAPIPLNTPSLPTFPDGIKPLWLGQMIEAVSAATETPTELAAMFAFAVLATACQKKFRVAIPGHSEPTNLWTVVALEPGNRKSAVMMAMTAPLLQWERDAAAAMKEEIEQAESDRKTIDARVKSLRDKAARADGETFDKAKREIAEMEADKPEVPAPPQAWAQDITPEQLGVVMARNGERLALFSDEGGIFDILAGRYSG